MSFDIERLTEGFERVFQDPAPPTAIDALRLISDGQRLVRRRRTVGALSGVATAGAAAALVVGLLPGVGGPAPSAGPAPLTGPLVNPAGFGWLPQTAQTISYTSAPGSATTVASFDSMLGSVSGVTGATAPSGSIDPVVATTSPTANLVPMSPIQLTLFAPQIQAAQLTPAPSDTDGRQASNADKPVEVGTVNGATAWLVDYPADGSPGNQLPETDFVTWQSSTGQWAELSSEGVAVAVLLRIARAADLSPGFADVPLELYGGLIGLHYTDADLRLSSQSMQYGFSGTIGDEQVNVFAQAGNFEDGTAGSCPLDHGQSATGGLVHECPTWSTDAGVEFPGAGGPNVGMEIGPPTVTPSNNAPSPGTTQLPTASGTLDGIHVEVTVSVGGKYDIGLADTIFADIASLGPDQHDWLPTDFTQ